MSKPRLLSQDPLTGISEYFEYDEDNSEFTITTRQDITPALMDAKDIMQDLNQKQARRSPGKHNGSFDTPIRVATIPLLVRQEMQKKGITPKNPKAYKRWLNAAENQVFRTRPGRV